nr:MAG TPA: Chitin oligosaccharide deacetylase [Caudoviricetes sp.]
MCYNKLDKDGDFMALETDRLKIKLIQETDQVSAKAWNDVIEDIDKKVAPQSHVGDRSHFELWEKNKSYTDGDIIRYGALRSNQYAICLSGGQSDTTEPTNNVTGSEINVGTARFKIVTLDKGTVEEFKINVWTSGTYYKSGSFVIYGDAIYKCKVNHVSDNVFSTDKDKWIELFSSIRAWKKNTYYAVGDTVLNGTDIVMCKTEHTSTVTYDEDKWEYVGNFALLEDWEKQKDYKKGQIIIFEKELYRAKEAHKSSDTFAKTKWEKVTRSGGIADWEADKSYSKDDVVYYAKNIYRALGDTKDTNFIPSSWERITDNIKFWDNAKNKPYLTGDTAVVHNTLVTVGNIGTSDLNSNTKPLNASIAEFDTSAIKYPVGTVVRKDDSIYQKIKDDKETDYTTFDEAVTQGSWKKISNNQITSFENKPYKAGEMVYHEGSIYVAKVDTGGAQVTDTSKWESLGGSGESTVNEWKPNTKYKDNQLVTFQGILLKAKSHDSQTDIDFTKFDVVFAGIKLHEKDKEYGKDSVIKTQDGSLYFALQNVPKNKDIEDSGFWKRISVQTNIKDWESDKQYLIGDIVTRNKDFYRAISDTKNATFDITNWEKLVNGDFGEWKQNTDYAVEQPIAINNLLVKATVNHNSGTQIPINNYKVMYASIPQWNRATYYPAGTLVWDIDGAFYYSITNVKDKDITPTDWVKMGSLNDWSSGNQYFAKDVVWYKNDLYRAKVDSSDSQFDVSKWEKLTQNGTIKIGTYTAGKNYEVGEVIKLASANTFYYVMHDFTATTEQNDIGVTPNLFPLVVINDFDGRAYGQNDIVRYNGKLYRARGLIAANSIFDPSQWYILNYSRAIRPWEKNTAYEQDSIINIYNIGYHTLADIRTGEELGGEFGAVEPQYASIAEWKEGAYYKQGVTVVSEGIAYRCITEHKSVHGGAGYTDVGGFLTKFPTGVVKTVNSYGERNDNLGTGFELPIDTREVIDHIAITASGNYVTNNLKITVTSGGKDIVVFESSGNDKFPSKIDIRRHITKVKVETDILPTYWYGGGRINDFQVRYKNPYWEKISEPDEIIIPEFAEPDPNHDISVAYNIGNIVKHNDSIYMCKKNCTNFNGITSDCWTLLVGTKQTETAPTVIKTYIKGATYKSGEFVYYDKALYRAKADITTTTDTPQETEFDKIGGGSTTTQQQTRIEDWSSAKDYKANDLVFYQGSLYRTISDISKSPTFQAQWNYVNGSAFIKNYTSGIAYSPNEVVIKDGIVYRAKQNTATTFNETEWDAIVKPATIDEWHANTPYIKGAVVTYNGNLWKAIEAFTSISDFNQDKWENLSGGGSGSVAGWKQVTKLNAPAGTKVTIKFKETLNFCFPPIDVLQLQAGTTNVIMNSYTFDVGDGGRFEYDENKVKFDGTVHCNTAINIPMTSPTTLGSGFMCMSDEIDLNDYNSVEGVYT